MAYSVEILYSKNEDYSNPQTVSEAGQPSSIELTNLESDQAYYIKAVLKNDGVVEDEDASKFTTLSAEEIECFYVKNTSDTDGTFTISENVVANNIQYYDPSTNNWWWVTSVPKTISVKSGEKLYLRGGSSLVVTSGADVRHFTMDVDHEIGGDIRSLLNWYDFQSNQKGVSTVTEIPDEAFRALFYDDSKLINAKDTIFGNVTIGVRSLFRMFSSCGNLLTPSDLSSVTSIGSNGCQSMYSKCTSLTTPSDLSNVTSIGDYGCQVMYSGCTALTTPSDLSNVTSIGDYGCGGMYRDCTSLTTPSDLSNVTSIGESGCGSMYHSCTSLTTGSDLSNVTSIGVNGCQYMYQNCTSLTTPADLSSVTSIGVNGCSSMYRYCTSLITGSNLSSVTSIDSGGCNFMYDGCTSLTEATAPNISAWVTSRFKSWLNNVAPTGVVYKPAGLEIPTDSVSGIPSGWTTQDY